MKKLMYCSVILLGLLVSETVQEQEVVLNRGTALRKKKTSQHLRRHSRSVQSIYSNKVQIDSSGGKAKKSPTKSNKVKSNKNTKSKKRSKKKKKDGNSIPNECTIPDSLTIENYNNGKCDPLFNTQECNFDGNDCHFFNQAYPDCKVDNPEFVGDEYCDGSLYNTTECGNDGGDCLVNAGGRLGCSGAMNGYCENIFNVPECDYDGGDCDEFNLLYPLCKVPEPSFVGDGRCDTPPYNTKECGHDGGDCKNFPVKCKVTDTYAIGDGTCQLQFNTTDCDYDGGDCLL